jgi:hypothetical protein
MLRGAGHVDVAKDVAGAVHARPLAVPEAEDAVELALAAQLRRLAAPERGGGEILVQARLEHDVGGFEVLSRARHLHVDRAERRAAIAGDEAGRVQPGRPVPRLLHQHQAHQRLSAVHQNRGFSRSNRSSSETF